MIIVSRQISVASILFTIVIVIVIVTLNIAIIIRISRQVGNKLPKLNNNLLLLRSFHNLLHHANYFIHSSTITITITININIINMSIMSIMSIVIDISNLIFVT